MVTGSIDSPGSATSRDIAPVSLGYASALPAARPARLASAAVVALAVGLVLLGLSLYALQHIMSSVMSPQGMALRNNDEFTVAMALIAVFAGICTLAGLVFLVVGLRWLGSVPRRD